jgi:hypothetical protein
MLSTTPRACVAACAAVFGAVALLVGPGASLALDVTGTSAVTNATTPSTSTQTPTTASAPRTAPKAHTTVRKASTHRASAPTSKRSAPAEATVQGTNPHGQGTVLAVSLGGNEAVVVGRSRGEQRPDGYHGHITTLALFGHDVIANDTGPGQTAKGPLAPLQEGLLDPICQGSSGNLCLDVLRADSATTNTGSTNHFRALGAQLGGAGGIQATAADSNGNIQQNGDCQTAHGDVTLLKLVAGGNPILDIGESASDSNACPSGTTVHNSENPLVAIGGQGIPFPGCGANSPGYLINLNPLLAIACNAGSQAGVGTVGNDSIVGTVLDTGSGSPGGVLTGAGTGAGATAPTSGNPGSQAVLGVRQTAPKQATAPTRHAARKAKRNAKRNGNGNNNAGAPNSANAQQPLSAAKASKLPYTGTDVLVVLLIACGLLGLGLTIRGGMEATRRSA